jgi:plastocyanin
MSGRARITAFAIASIVSIATVATVSPAIANTARQSKTYHVAVGQNGSPQFVPDRIYVHMGDTVQWDWQSDAHSSTDSSGLGLWDSGVLNEGATFSRIFTASATYHYESTPDPGMTGVVRVPMHVHPKSGVAGKTEFTFTWATADPPPGVLYQAQLLGPGSDRWGTFSEGTQRSFKTGLGAVGTWYVRARLIRPVDDTYTHWSPTLVVIAS